MNNTEPNLAKCKEQKARIEQRYTRLLTQLETDRKREIDNLYYQHLAGTPYAYRRDEILGN